MHKISFFIFKMILLALAGVSFSACSDDNTAEDYRNHMTDIFQDLKDNYTGYITMPDNSSRTLKATIADETAGGVVTTKVKVGSFPIEMALAKLYPTDWNRLQLSDAAAYEAPIDSVGYQMNFMNFKTNDEFTPQTTFAFKDSKGNEHSGWAKISTTGQFFSQVGTLNLSFSVIDLVVDEADCTSVLPLTFTVTMQKVKESSVSE